MAKATFAAGCFWGVEAAFRQVEGVLSTRVGYIGGQTDMPTYKDVCSDKTGHAEAVEIEYDPAMVRFDHLLAVFWENRQFRTSTAAMAKPTRPLRANRIAGTSQKPWA